MWSQATDTLLTSLAWRPPSPGHRLSGRSGEALPPQVYYRANCALSHENPADPDVLLVYEDRFAMMTPRAVIDLDDQLVADVAKALGTRTEKETVSTALREVLENRRRALALTRLRASAAEGAFDLGFFEDKENYRR